MYVLKKNKRKIKINKQKGNQKKINKTKLKTFLYDSLVRLYLTKKMVKSVIYLLFSYQTGYIMWHYNVTLYTLSDSWITYNVLQYISKWPLHLCLKLYIINYFTWIVCIHQQQQKWRYYRYHAWSRSSFGYASSHFR